MAKARSYLWTVEDFLAFEVQEPERYEFVDGVVRMMTGGSVAHGIIKSNMANSLNAALGEGPCIAIVDELKVVTETAVMYPDVVVACGPLAPDDDRISDPAVVVEVLSPTTERHDRIAKWREYQRIGSLQHCRSDCAKGAPDRGSLTHGARLGVGCHRTSRRCGGAGGSGRDIVARGDLRAQRPLSSKSRRRGDLIAD